MIKRTNLFIIAFLLSGLYCCSDIKQFNDDENRIKPFIGNNSYWQYKRQPVLLLGATDNDNLFQNKNIESHLDSLKAIGGNYIRNVMSDRDPGNTRAFVMTSENKYDLTQWNDEYWERFENMLRLTLERDIIVQIEIWDRFDHSGDLWLSDPYNPKNNNNYTYAEARLDSQYLNPSNRTQHFFLTVPTLDNNEILLNIQKDFVKKMLSISLEYGHVIYCIDNETTGPEEWGSFWADFIQENVQGKDIYITQIWNNWDLKTNMHKWSFDHPDRYRYLDISQNSHNTGGLNWDNARYVFNYIENKPRPVNSTKIYGSDNYGSWLDRGINTEHAVQTFFRNILGGFASSRFHRPPHGLGLSEPSINTIKTIREIENHVKMWEINPRMYLLQDVDENEAYLSAKDGEKYVIYFPKEGKVELDLSSHNHSFSLRWINTNNAEWTKTEEISGGKIVDLEAANEKGSIAVLIRSDLKTAGN